MVAANRDGIVFWRIAGAEFDGVADQADSWLYRKNPSPASDVFFENIVLGGAAHFRQWNPLLLGDHEIHRHDGSGYSVDGE